MLTALAGPSGTHRVSRFADANLTAADDFPTLDALIEPALRNCRLFAEGTAVNPRPDREVVT